MYSFFEGFFRFDETVKSIPILCSKLHCVSFKFGWGYCRLLFMNFCGAFVQCLTVAGVSQPSSNVAREIRISQDPQGYLVLFSSDVRWCSWLGRHCLFQSQFCEYM